MTQVSMPHAMATRELLTGLVGRDVAVRSGAAMMSLDAPGGLMVGTYVDQRSVMRALVVVDLAAAAHLGASIALIPPAAAHGAIEDGQLPDSLAQNTAEVLNVMASLFNEDGAVHLRLDQWYAPGQWLPPTVGKWVDAWVDRLNLTIDVSGYGDGYLSIASGFSA